jgi:hypothetical protein
MKDSLPIFAEALNVVYQTLRSENSTIGLISTHLEEMKGEILKSVAARDEAKSAEEEKWKQEIQRSITTITERVSQNQQPIFSYANAAKAGASNTPGPAPVRVITLLSGVDEQRPQEEFLREKKAVGQILKGKGVIPVNIRQSRKGNIVIELASSGDKETAKETFKLKDIRYNDADEREVPLFFRGLQGKTEDEGKQLESELRESNPELSDAKFVWIKRKNRDGKETFVPKILAGRTLAQKLLSGYRVTNSERYDSYRVSLWKVSPLTCGKCLQRAHTAAKCTAMEPACRSCGESHEGGCTNVVSCTWCKKEGKPDCNHPAKPQECPTWKGWADAANRDLAKFVGWTPNDD